MCTAALDYLKTHPVDPIDTKAFEQYCGVGVVISQEEITQCVSAAKSLGQKCVMYSVLVMKIQ